MSVNLQKGQKAELTKGRHKVCKLLVGLGWRTGEKLSLDTAAFLLGENRRVAREEDFVFYGNLRHTSGSVEHKGGTANTVGCPDMEQISVNLPLVPENVNYIAITATIYDAESRQQNFGQVADAYIRIADEESGQELLRYNLGNNFSVETAIIVGEIYRHKGEWKFNAVGGGYKGGLAALCNSFGIEVAEDEGNSPPPPTAKRQSESPVLRPGLTAVNLKKGQKISLEKRDGSGLKRVLVGLGWDPANPTGSGIIESLTGNIDCDASAFLCTDGYIAENSDIIYFGRLQHKSGAVKHMGDNLTGEGEGDDEQIWVNLAQLPRRYDKIVFVVNIFHFFKTKQHFGMIKNAFMRIVDAETGRELCRFSLTDDYSGMKAVIFGELYRREDKWLFAPIGKGTVDDSVQELAQHYMRRR